MSERDIDALCEAIRLTVEYIGVDALPPIEGWSWYDALKKYRPDMLEDLPKPQKPQPAVPRKRYTCSWEALNPTVSAEFYHVAETLYGTLVSRVIEYPRLRWQDIPLDEQAAWIFLAKRAKELLVEPDPTPQTLTMGGKTHQVAIMTADGVTVTLTLGKEV